MHNFVIPPAQPVTVPVRGGGRFPVRRIFCVGRNYADHVREMGGDPTREPPIFFTKPADVLVTDGQDTPYPPMTGDLHHEVELVVALGTAAENLSPEQAAGCIYGYAVGLDMTRRDLQREAQKAGRPWDMSKGFDHSAPIGEIVPADQAGNPHAANIRLRVNETLRQTGNTADLITPVPEIIASLSALVALRPGDLIFTGTPSGVGAVIVGDRLQAEIDGLSILRTIIVSPRI